MGMREEESTIPKGLLLLSVTYDGASGKALVKLYDVTSGKTVLWYDNLGHKPYLLTDIMPDEIVEKYPQVIRHKGFDHLEVVEKLDLLKECKVILTKVVAKDPLSIGGVAGSIRDILPRSWEARIKYYLCYLYDVDLVPGMYYKVENGVLKRVPIRIPQNVKEIVAKMYPGDEELRNEALKWATLFHAPIPHLRRLAIDIEVHTPVPDRIPNPREALYQVVCVACVSTDGTKRVLLLRRRGVPEGTKPKELPDDVKIDFFDDEKELIAEVFKIINNYPVVITFNGDNFDLLYLYHRALKLGFREEDIPIILGRDRADVKKGVHIDLYRFFSNRAMQVYAFNNKYQEAKTLDSISQALLGVGKVKPSRPIPELPLLELASYCYRDAYLTLSLTQFDNDLVMKLMILMMRIAKLPIEDIARAGISAWVKSMLYYEHRRKGYLIPNPEDILRVKGRAATKAVIKGKKYLGALVIDPPPGIFFNVTVVDFASLYPSMIKTWNLSYETVRCNHEECKNNRIPGTPHWVCKKRRGLSSTVIGFLRDFRIYVYKPLSKDKNADKALRIQYDVVQRALKVFINASYGVFGADTFPLYCPPVAESTTALGRFAIYSTISKALDMGLAVLYGDTDSLFLWNSPEDKVRELLRWVSESLHIDLDIDKKYRFVIFSGLKKNYIGVYEDGGLDIKGMIGKKRNTPQFIKDLFFELSSLLSKLENVKDIAQTIEAIKKLARDSYLRLKKKEYTLDQLAFRVALSKHPNDYIKTTPQHVKAAKLLMKYGINIELGDIVSYVKVKGGDGVKPVQLARIDEVDEERYMDYLETTFRQVLKALGVDFDEIIGSQHMDRFLNQLV